MYKYNFNFVNVTVKLLCKKEVDGIMQLYPLSQAQKRIWFVQKKYRNSSLFNIGGTVEIKGTVDRIVLKQALECVYSQNIALQLQFTEVGNEIFQYTEKNLFVDKIDFTREINPWEEYRKWCKKQAAVPFAMVDASLCYFNIFKITAQDTGYFIKIHHIIADGWSIKLLTDQISDVYEKILNTKVQEKAEGASYLDYLCAEEKYLNSVDFSLAKKYWMDKFSDLPEVNSPRESLEANRKSFYLNQSLQRDLEDYINQNHLSLNTFFLCLYLIYDYKKNGREDIVLGTPLLGRSNRSERQIFGTFTNTMPYRYYVNEEKTVNKMLKEVSADIKNSFKYQKYPYNILHDDLELTKKGIGYLYNTCINYYNTTICSKLQGMSVINTEFHNGEQEYPLQIVIRHWNENKLQLDFDYQKTIYEEWQIEDLFNQMEVIIYQILEKDTVYIKDILLLDKKQCEKVIYEYNQTKCSYPKTETIIDLFCRGVREHPNKTAISKGTENITYKRLNNLSNMAAITLINKGVKRGDKVAIIPEYTIDSIAAILAIMKCGAVYLPLDSDMPDERKKQILSDAAVHLLLSNNDAIYFEGCIMSLQDLTCSNSEIININHSSADDITYILYTSGSTGKPKGVMVTNKNLLNYLWWAASKYIKSGEEIFPLYSSFSFDFTLTSIFLPLISGNELRIYNKFQNHNIFRDILLDNKATILKITPSHIPLLKDAVTEKCAIHTIIVGGEDLKVSVCHKLKGLFGKGTDIYNEYGPTETTIGCMIYCYKENETSISVPIGRPIANTQIYLLDKNQKPVPDYMVGEIYIGGDGVSKGYHGANRETKEKFLKNPFLIDSIFYKSGDLAYRNKAGDIIYYGRYDKQQKIRGYRVNMFEVEEQIISSGLVKEAYVKTINTHNSGYQLCAYITGMCESDIFSLKSLLKKQLPYYMVPEFYIILKAMPVNRNGKIDERFLPLPNKDDKMHVEKVKEEFTILTEIMKTVIPEIDISQNINFYELGGDSIKAILVSTRLYERGYDLSVKDILIHPNLVEMSAFLTKRQESFCNQDILTGEFPATPMSQRFFESQFTCEGFYNQSILLELKLKLQEKELNDIFSEIIKHHDGLRLNCERNGNEVYYNNTHLQAENFVSSIVCEADSVFGPDFLKERTNQEFDLKNDLLIRPYFIKVQEKNYLYIVIHHLVSDGISLRILLEDLTNLLRNFSYGSDKITRLPEKTMSCKEYVECYRNWSVNAAIDRAFWMDIVHTNILYNQILDKTICNYGDTTNGYFELTEEQTKLLLSKANNAFKTKTEELLMIALVNTYRDIFKWNELVVEVESHGRDIIEDININRTIGWFTANYPMKLKVTSENRMEKIKELKAQIRRIAKRKYEYGALKYNDKGSLKSRPMIRFNYLGEFIDCGSEILALKNVMIQDNVGPKNHFPYVSDVNIFICQSRLQVYLRYGLLKEESYIQLTEGFKKEILVIIEHCCNLNTHFYTPEDFEMVNLSKEELDWLVENTPETP
jgi:amino acid adenylation domain-containing protein/non-ribosomal peptide synthase protein (TIGR01720 family)